VESWDEWHLNGKEASRLTTKPAPC
jgi:hypothetical protein